MARFEEQRGMEHERHRAHRGKGKHARHASDVVSQYHVERPSLDRPNRAPGLIDVCERLRKRSSSHAPVKFDAISTRYAWLPRRARRDDDDLVPAPSRPVRCRLHDSRRSTRAIRNHCSASTRIRIEIGRGYASTDAPVPCMTTPSVVAQLFALDRTAIGDGSGRAMTARRLASIRSTSRRSGALLGIARPSWPSAAATCHWWSSTCSR